MNSKIFLSGGGDIKQTFELDEIFFNSLKKNSKILYIPIDLNRDAKGFESCSDWFSEIIDLHSGDKNIDFTMFLEGESFPVLEEYEAIYIGGGNTFKLLDYLTRTGLKELLLNYLEGNHVIYGGSAGAIILGSSIGTVEEENDNNYIHYDGLNVVNEYSIICHYEPELDNNILSFSKENNLKIIALEEDAGLVIDGENVEAVGRVFVFKNGNKEPLKMLK
jgi:dipeptidase E